MLRFTEAFGCDHEERRMSEGSCQSSPVLRIPMVEHSVTSLVLAIGRPQLAKSGWMWRRCLGAMPRRKRMFRSLSGSQHMAAHEGKKELEISKDVLPTHLH